MVIGVILLGFITLVSEGGLANNGAHSSHKQMYVYAYRTMLNNYQGKIYTRFVPYNIMDKKDAV